MSGYVGSYVGTEIGAASESTHLDFWPYNTIKIVQYEDAWFMPTGNIDIPFEERFDNRCPLLCELGQVYI